MSTSQQVLPSHQGLRVPPASTALRLAPAGATYPAGGEVSGLSTKLIDLRFGNIGALLSLLELMLSFPELGEMSVGLFILKPERPGR